MQHPWTAERGGFGQRFQGCIKIISYVRPEMQLPAGLQDTLNFLDEDFIHDTSLVMAFLPPWIGEIDMYCRQTAIAYMVDY